MKRSLNCFAILLAVAIAMAPGSASAEPVRGSADIDGIELHYRADGRNDGTPLLFLHGAFGGGDDMIPLADAFAHTRPVITVDLRGHGRSSDTDAPYVFEELAEDVAALAGELGFGSVDVIGYSMGGTVALHLAHRYPELVSHLVVVSSPHRLDGWHEEVLQAVSNLSPEMFRGTSLEADYRNLSATPDGFGRLIGRVRAAYHLSENLTEDQISAIDVPTMIVVGDADAVRLDHAVEFFRLRGGWDGEAAQMGFSQDVPRARLSILPGVTHIAILGMAERIAADVTPFLNDEPYALPAWE